MIALTFLPTVRPERKNFIAPPPELKDDAEQD
jgi:hypothetical protein